MSGLDAAAATLRTEVESMALLYARLQEENLDGLTVASDVQRRGLTALAVAGLLEAIAAPHGNLRERRREWINWLLKVDAEAHAVAAAVVGAS